MKSFFVSVTLVFLFSLPGVSQNTATRAVRGNTVSATAATDTLSPIYKYYFGDIDSLYYEDEYVLRRIKPNLDTYRLYLPFTYYNSPLKRVTTLKWKAPSAEELFQPKQIINLMDTTQLVHSEKVRAFIDKALLSSYITIPQYVVSYEDQIMSKPVLKEQDLIVEKAPSKTPILRLFTPDKPEESVGDASLVINKPNFWVTGGNGSFQMSQNSVSDNWYQGGESMNNILANVKLFANYNDKNKIQFESTLEAKAGFNTVSSDTVRKYRVNTDLLRLYTKLGVQAANRWFYTVSGEFTTQFFNNYNANSNDMVSSFLAPANLILSIGMDYKLKNTKVDLSVFMSPLAYNLRYVGNDKVDETKFGLDKGKKTLHDFGSKFQTNLSWKIIASINYTTRLYYFTNYEKVEAEWENSIDFILNRYLSTKLFVHCRYDDSINREPDKSYFQFKQYLSFGLNYNW